MKPFVIHLLVALFALTWCSPWQTVSHDHTPPANVEQTPTADAEDATAELLEEADDDEVTRAEVAWVMPSATAPLDTRAVRKRVGFKSPLREVMGPPPRATWFCGIP